MTETLYELEGTWDELAEHAPELQGKRLRLSVLTGADGDAPMTTLGEMLDKIAADIPPSDWDAIPKDLTDRLDHYLYGTISE